MLRFQFQTPFFQHLKDQIFSNLGVSLLSSAFSSTGLTKEFQVIAEVYCLLLRRLHLLEQANQ